MPLLRREIVPRLDDPLPRFPARSGQLRRGTTSERFHLHGRELVVRGPELGARVASAMLAPQPLAVEQMRSREIRTQLRPSKALDRLLVEPFRDGALAHQRPRPCLDAEAPV